VFNERRERRGGERDLPKDESMKRFFKIIGAFIGGLIVLAAIGIAGLYVYDQYIFKPIEEVDGVYLGMSRQDLLFKTRLDMRCSPEETDQTECDFFRYLNPSRLIGYSKEDLFMPNGVIRLEDDRVVALSKDLFIPLDLKTQVYNTGALIKKLGDPDLLVVSKDFTRRSYLYVEQNLIFYYRQDSLERINLGKSHPLELGVVETNRLETKGLSYAFDGSEVLVGGATVCPGDVCPYDEGGEINHEKALYSLEELVRIFSD
jgi:hypothetical protein